MVSEQKFPAQFSAVIRQRMQATGTSTSRLSVETSIPRETLNRRLKGKAFTADEMAALAAYFQTTVTDLCRAAEELDLSECAA